MRSERKRRSLAIRRIVFWLGRGRRGTCPKHLRRIIVLPIGHTQALASRPIALAAGIDLRRRRGGLVAPIVRPGLRRPTPQLPGAVAYKAERQVHVLSPIDHRNPSSNRCASLAGNAASRRHADRKFLLILALPAGFEPACSPKGCYRFLKGTSRILIRLACERGYFGWGKLGL